MSSSKNLISLWKTAWLTSFKNSQFRSRFNLLHVCLSVPSFLFAVLFISCFNLLSCYFYDSLNLLAVPATWILIKFVTQLLQGTGKRATKNVQLVLQHCCKTSWIAMLYVLPPVFKPVNKLICCKTGLMWVVKRAISLFNSSFAAMLQNKLHVFWSEVYEIIHLLLSDYSFI